MIPAWTKWTKKWTGSLRFQLTAWSLLAVALILLPTAALCYGLIREALLRETDQALAGGAAQVLRRLADTGEAEDDRPPPRPAAIVTASRLAPATLPGIGADPLYLRLVRAGTGQTAALSSDLTPQPAFLASLQSLPPVPHGPAFAGRGDDDRMRCLTVAVPRSPYLLQVAAPWDPAEDLLARLMTGLVLTSLLFQTLSGIGSWLLVGRALRPIDHIVSEAERLTADRLSPVLLNPLLLNPVLVSRRSLSDNEIGHLVTALNGMMTRLSAAFAGQRQFTADASHEMRTPLTILRGEFELALSRERTAADYRRTLESGLEEVLRMTRIIESLSFLARGDSGPAHSHVSVSLSALVSEVTTAMQQRARDKGLHLTLESNGEAAVRGDGDALRRMAQNLIENALAYTPSGGEVHVSVSVSKGKCRLCVADTGVGIAPEDLPHVFDRFFRGDKSRANTGGSGLGLSIVQSIVQAHGGQVEAESEPGHGSRFVVTLPKD